MGAAGRAENILLNFLVLYIQKAYLYIQKRNYLI
jgi:hypothetical protein